MKTAKQVWVLFILMVWFLVAPSCRSNPFGGTPKSGEEFAVYTTDFMAQQDGGMRAALLDVINSSRTTLLCAFSALTMSEVGNALIARARAGIQVKIVFDADARDNDAGALALQASGIFGVDVVSVDTQQSVLLFGNGGGAAMRHNYCMADEQLIFISTAAPDDAQMRKMPNVALKIGGSQSGLARDFLRESNLFSQLIFGHNKAKTDFLTKFTALNQVIAAYWGPQEKPLDTLGAELSEAVSSVDFYATAFQTTNSTETEVDLPRVLLRLEAGKGLPVRKYFSSQALFETSSKAYTLTNPAQFMSGDVRIGANIFVVDRGLPTAKTFIYTGSLRSQANSSDDSVLIELRGNYVAGIVAAYLDSIGIASVVASNNGDTSHAGAVVISEINWAGSYSNSAAIDSSDEFLELHNTTANAVNISGWRFACTTDGGATVSSYFQLPSGAAIAAHGYFTVATKSTGAFPNAAFYTNQLSITNSSRECRLTNGKTAASTYPEQSGLTGDTIDTAGDNTTAFDNSGNVLGMNDATNKVRRSMERKFPVGAGNLLGSWQSNTNSVAQNIGIDSQYNQKTFGSPGSGASVQIPSMARNLVINEVGVTSSGNNDFIEIYNPTGSAVDLAAAGVYIQRDSACNLTGGITATIALTGTVPAGGYYVIAETGHSLPNVNQAGLGNIASGYCVILTENATAVTDANNGQVIDWVTIAGSGSAENASYAPETGSNGAIARVPDGRDTNRNAVDFLLLPASPGVLNPTPSFNMTSATAASTTQLTIFFDRNVNAAQAQVAGNYCISLAAEPDCHAPDLSILAAVPTGNKVQITTSPQISGENYRLYATGISENSTGTPLMVSTAIFSGYVQSAVLVINEVAPNEASGRDLIELYAVSGGSVDGFQIFEGGSSLKTLPAAIVATGDYLVIHINAPGADELTAKHQSADPGSIAVAWDFWSSDAGLTATDNAIILKKSDGTILDACIFANNSGTWTGPTLSTVIDPLIAANQWTKAGGTLVESDAINHAASIPAGSSFRRSPNASDANNSRLDWASAAGLTIGFANP